jgi:hypothetical protein
MAVELLLKNVDDIHPDPAIDRISSLKRGDLVYAKEIPHDNWNEYETLPEFSRLIVSDATISGVASYMEPWYLELEYENLGYDPVNDIYEVRMYSNTPGIGQIGVLNPVDVYHHLDNWNLTISGVASNEIIFTADIKEVVLSRNFWTGISTGLVITPVSFDSGNKIHTLKVSYAGYAIEKSRVYARSMVEQILLSHGATIEHESIYGQLMEITLPSTTVINQFKTKMATATHKIVFARRYYISNAAMNAIQTYMQNNNGDAMTTNKATLLGYLNDRLEEY